jgi:hypothetical protein
MAAYMLIAMQARDPPPSGPIKAGDLCATPAAETGKRHAGVRMALFNKRAAWRLRVNTPNGESSLSCLGSARSAASVDRNLKCGRAGENRAAGVLIVRSPLGQGEMTMMSTGSSSLPVPRRTASKTRSRMPSAVPRAPSGRSAGSRCWKRAATSRTARWRITRSLSKSGFTLDDD